MPEGIIKGLKNLKETPFSFDGVHTEVSFEVTSEKDMSLMERGLACTNCLTIFPATPEPKNLKQFDGFCDRWPINNEVMRARINDKACPICGMYINPEAIQRQIIDNRPKPADERPYDNLPTENPE